MKKALPLILFFLLVLPAAGSFDTQAGMPIVSPPHK